MNELAIFENPKFGQVRTIEEDGKVLFCAKDVAAALGYKNTRDAINRHCKGVVKRDGVSRTTNQHGVTTEQTVEMAFIPEGDIYRLAAKSELPGADEFESWIFDEVIPSIRKHGAYMTEDTLDRMINSPEFGIKLLTALKEEKDKRKALEVANSELTVQNAIMAPKADYFDDLVDRHLLTSFRDTAKELGIPPKAFVGWLLEKKFLYRDKKHKLVPYENKNDGLFEVRESKNDKTGWAGTQTLVTPKGRETFRLLYLNAGPKN